ncbi:MAG TPA: hypothetical protein VMT50_09880, partial [Steroidobacteraceae bacterium]|nr:hypothetical protein [Steroidobacteraceae bacterium]
AEGVPGGAAACHPMDRDHALAGSSGGYLYVGRVPAVRPASHYTPRVVPFHPGAEVPLEANLIRWYPQ